MFVWYSATLSNISAGLIMSRVYIPCVYVLNKVYPHHPTNGKISISLIFHLCRSMLSRSKNWISSTGSRIRSPYPLVSGGTQTNSSKRCGKCWTWFECEYQHLAHVRQSQRPRADNKTILQGIQNREDRHLTTVPLSYYDADVVLSKTSAMPSIKRSRSS